MIRKLLKMKIIGLTADLQNQETVGATVFTSPSGDFDAH